MLYIYTDKSLLPKDKMLIRYINLYFDQFQMMQFDYVDMPEVLHALSSIDGVTEHKDGVVNTEFGWTMINNVSTGCKAVILGICRPEFVISNVEVGRNAMAEMFHAALTKDIYIYLEHPIGATGPWEQEVYYDNEKITAHEAFTKSIEKRDYDFI